jgi:cell fate regulator YaaT (PSP1 superfamily)
MGCGNCGTGANGKPSGCKGNGGCSSGGCNRLNVYDWLNALPLTDNARPYAVVEMSFSKGSRKEFFRNNTNHILEKGDWYTVEGVGGYDVGQISLTGELVKLQLKKYGVKEADVTKRIMHPSTDEELDIRIRQKDREAELLTRSRAIARNLKLDMKLCEVEVQADSKKGTFFYTADQRVDFRELIKVFASDFKMKIEMKQIGARQESGKVGGIGSCGRELCCSTWLTDFKSVNTTAARYQNLSINQVKLSGQCGRLKCCLNYELDTYMDALSVFPDHAEHLDTVKGVAHLQKKDIFKNLMWYSYSDNNKQYPLSIERVREIQKQNKQGQKADELQPVELETKDTKSGVKSDMGFVNDVGQISLRALEKNKKKKPGNKNQQQGKGQQGGGERPQQNKQGGGQQENKGQQRQGGQQPKQGGGGNNNNNNNNRPQQNKQGGNRPQGQQGQQGGGERPQQGAQPQGNQRERQGNKGNQQGNRGGQQGNRGGQQQQGGQQQGRQQQRPQNNARPQQPRAQNNEQPKAPADQPPKEQ